MAYQLDPVKWLAAKRQRDAFDSSGTISPFTKGAFPTAVMKNREDTGSTKGLGTFGDVSGVEGKKTMFGGKFDEMGDTVNMFMDMDKGSTELAKAQEFKKYADAMEAKERAACNSSKKKKLIGSVITGGIGIFTQNPQMIAAGASGVAASGGGFQITNSGVCQITTSAQNSSGATVTHFGIWDAASSGNFLASGSLTTNVDVQLGDTVQFNAAAMAIKVI